MGEIERVEAKTGPLQRLLDVRLLDSFLSAGSLFVAKGRSYSRLGFVSARGEVGRRCLELTGGTNELGRRVVEGNAGLIVYEERLVNS